jgi:tol-pal system protein YbgF
VGEDEAMIGRRLWRLGAGLLLLSGCAIDPKEFETLRELVKHQQKQIADLNARQDQQALRVDTLNDGFRILGDKADESSRRIDGIEERAAGGAGLPAAAAAPAAPASAVAPPPPPPPAAPPPAPETASVLLTNRPAVAAAAPETRPGDELISPGQQAEKLYTAALGLFSKRSYDEAAAKFQEFVGEYADHKLAGNAQYWIGECAYSQKRFKEAADEFAKVERLYPASPKVPGALLKKGLSLWELKRLPEAQEALERIVAKYPQSDEAAKARERLDRWKQQ